MTLRAITLSFFIGAWTALTAYAVPADPRPKRILQADGTWITVRVMGDENGSTMLTEDGRMVVYNATTGCFEPAPYNASGTTPTVNAPRKAIKRGMGPSRIKINDFPTIGKQRSLVLLVEFSDTRFTSVNDPKDFYTRMLNEEGFTHSNGANGSARDFYISSSAGQFMPEFVVAGPIILPHTADYYGSDYPQRDANVAEALRDACLAADDEIDFSLFDNNGDGYVDNIYYFYAGHGQADNPTAVNTIWPHSANLEDAGVELTCDGVKINNYACSNELAFDGSNVPTPTGIGTFVHEFGHVLGLADHYDVYDSRTFTVGPWDTMSTGSYNNNGHTPPLFSAFERAELGWLSYDDLAGDTDTVSIIHDLKDSNRAYRVRVPGNDNEYYILENRQQTGWDAWLPGHGMLVWHIDMDEEAWHDNTVNTVTNHQRVDIVAADGRRTDVSRDGDPFPGVAGITQATLSAWSGDELLSFDAIAEQRQVVKFALAGVDCRIPRPAEITVGALADSSFTVTWSEVPAAAFYELSICLIDNAGQRTPVDGFDKMITEEPTVINVGQLSPESDYEISVVAGMGSYRSEVVTKTVRTTEIPFEKLKPEITDVTDVTATGFTASWTPVDDADGYIINLYAYGMGSQPEELGYDFSTKADGMPDMWTTSSSTYYSVSGWYGETAPSLRMSADGDYLEVAWPESSIVGLSFWCRSRNGDGHVCVDAYKDGAWNEIGSVVPPVDGQTLTFSLDGCDKARIRYARESGFIVIDDVYATCNRLERTPVEGYYGMEVGNVLSYTFGGLTPSATYSLRVIATSDGQRSLASDEHLVTTVATDGIERVEQDNAPTTVYDLSGRRLSHTNYPNQLLIIRQGGKTGKYIGRKQ